MYQQKSDRALTLKLAIFASLLVHALVFIAGWHSVSTINISTLPEGSARFQVSLIENPLPASKTSTEKSIPSTPRPADNTTRTRKQVIDKVVGNLTEQNTQPTDFEVTKQAVSNTSSNIANNMVQYLNAEFRARFKYPLVARKRGWQGKVIVALDVSEAGDIHNINIKQSSGHTILDKNAVRTFREIGSINGLGKDYQHNYKLDIPVIYKLTKG